MKIHFNQCRKSIKIVATIVGGVILGSAIFFYWISSHSAIQEPAIAAAQRAEHPSGPSNQSDNGNPSKSLNDMLDPFDWNPEPNHTLRQSRVNKAAEEQVNEKTPAIASVPQNVDAQGTSEIPASVSVDDAVADKTNGNSSSILDPFEMKPEVLGNKPADPSGQPVVLSKSKSSRQLEREARTKRAAELSAKRTAEQAAQRAAEHRAQQRRQQAMALQRQREMELEILEYQRFVHQRQQRELEQMQLQAQQQAEAYHRQAEARVNDEVERKMQRYREQMSRRLGAMGGGW